MYMYKQNTFGKDGNPWKISDLISTYNLILKVDLKHSKNAFTYISGSSRMRCLFFDQPRLFYVLFWFNTVFFVKLKDKEKQNGVC